MAIKAAGLGATLLIAALAAATTMAVLAPAAQPQVTAAANEAAAGGRRADLLRLVQSDPGNGRAWVLLGFLDAEAGRYAESATAFERALATSRKVALDPAVWCEYADVLGMTRGTLAGSPTEAILKALALRPDYPKALEMAGSAAYERRDFAAAAHYWRSLLPHLQAGTQLHRELSAAIERADRLAATSLPPA